MVNTDPKQGLYLATCEGVLTDVLALLAEIANAIVSQITPDRIGDGGP
jgi:hypothetical protein